MENYPIINKIISADANTYVIFFAYGCSYSEKALNFLRKNNLTFKGYNIDSIKGSLEKILGIFKQNAQLINFDINYRTKPLIFINGKFIGGYNELINQK